jgi:hypothetical protein
MTKKMLLMVVIPPLISGSILEGAFISTMLTWSWYAQTLLPRGEAPVFNGAPSIANETAYVFPSNPISADGLTTSLAMSSSRNRSGR